MWTEFVVLLESFAEQKLVERLQTDLELGLFAAFAVQFEMFELFVYQVVIGSLDEQTALGADQWTGFVVLLELFASQEPTGELQTVFVLSLDAAFAIQFELHFVYQVVTGNFDRQVVLETDQWTDFVVWPGLSALQELTGRLLTALELSLDGVAAIAVLSMLHFVYKLTIEYLDKLTVKETDQFVALVELFALQELTERLQTALELRLDGVFAVQLELYFVYPVAIGNLDEQTAWETDQEADFVAFLELFA